VAHEFVQGVTEDGELPIILDVAEGFLGRQQAGVGTKRLYGTNE